MPIYFHRLGSQITCYVLSFIYKINKEAVMKCVTFGPYEFNFLAEVASVIVYAYTTDTEEILRGELCK